jgi:hypothetical protein
MDNSGASDTLVLVVVVALVAVGLSIAMRKRKNIGHPSSRPASDGTHPHSAEMQIRFAAVVKTEQVREAGQSPEKAAMLFSNAKMHWAGLEMAWSDLAAGMELPTLSGCPSEDGKDVIVTFMGPLLESEIPTNRLATRSRLNDLAAKGRLDFSGLYDRPFAVNPLRFGFEQA